ncbi:MAG: type II secretion system F family protein [Nanopusillaceae archaeon]
MKEFVYKASDPSGKVFTGRLKANSEREAISLLRQRQYLILDLKEERSSSGIYISLKKRRISEEDYYSFFRELSILLRSGVPMDRALRILANSVEKEDLKNSIEKILEGLREGKDVNVAFREANFISQPQVLSMISAGESIGNLHQAFANIADFIQFQIQLRREIREALTYPLFLVVASILSLLVIFHVILPKFFGLFGEVSLPLPAKILMSMGVFFQGKVLIFVGMVIVSAYILRKLGFLEREFNLGRSLIFRLPILRGLLSLLDLSRFSYAMHSMLRGGLDFVDALYLSKNLIYTAELRNFFENAIFEIRRGTSIKETFSRSEKLPEIFKHMIAVGEETASLKEVFFELYQIYNDKFTSRVKRLLALVEPLIITLTGIIVGFIVISLILTVMSAGVIKL